MEVSHLWEQWSSPGPGPAYPGNFGSLFHQPALWYSPHWREMTAFALPSIAHGYIRINLRGRESNGVVPPRSYHLVCDELSAQLEGLRDARTGRRLVREVVRTRASSDQCGPDCPDADLIVFYEPAPTDVVDSPTFGRIGPVPFGRTGGHVNRGFAILKAGRYQAGSILPQGRVSDLAPTMLELLGAPVPDYLEGTPLTSESGRRIRASEAIE
jgi:predicted AlkP superfamily phosphohydrolase/phosphomutase